VRYALRVNQTSQGETSRSLGKTVVAVLVLVVVGYILLKVIIGIALAIAGPLVLILGVLALIWAWRTLF
jgi:protein-S-isoprenylcysteine O-methyltransferase Ste14